MNKILFVFLICLAALSTAGATEEYISKELGCAFYIPPGWSIDSVADNKIIIADNFDPSRNIMIIKYLIERNNQIGSDEELIEAIAGLYRDIGIMIENNEEIACSIEDKKAVFEIEFDDQKTSEEIIYHKSLKGVLGRFASGGQVLYLIVAEAPKELYESSLADINLLLHSFHITERLSDELYVRRDLAPYLLILLIFLLIAFFYARNRRVQKSKNPLGRDSSHFWRCPSCRRVNHIDNARCNRCGREREIIPSSKR